MDDVTEIGQLVAHERQNRVRVRPDELTALFHPDAVVETSWLRGGAAAFAAGASQRSASSGPILNRVGPPVITVEGDRGFVELPSTTTRWIPVGGVEAVLVSFMRLLYRVERRDGVWRISALHAINEGDTLEAAVPGAALVVDEDRLGGLRHSYRWLAYTKLDTGGELSQDLYGTDRPEQLDALYADIDRWLTGGPGPQA